MNATSKPGSVMPFERNQMFNGTTVAQLRDIAFTCNLDQKQVSAAKNKAELRTLLTEASDQKRIWTVAHRYEAVLPYKHLFLFAWKTDQQNLVAAEVERSITEHFPVAFESFSPPREVNDEFHLEAGVVDKDRDRLYLKFVHFVDFVEWKTEDEITYRKSKAKKRHPIVFNAPLV